MLTAKRFVQAFAPRSVPLNLDRQSLLERVCDNLSWFVYHIEFVGTQLRKFSRSVTLHQRRTKIKYAAC